MRLLAIIPLLFCIGCGDRSRDRLIEEQLDTMVETTALLKTITDVDSARAAKPKLQEIGERMSSYRRREKDLPSVDDDDKERLRKKYKNRINEIGIYAEAVVFMKITGPPGVREEIGKELDALQPRYQNVLILLNKPGE